MCPWYSNGERGFILCLSGVHCWGAVHAQLGVGMNPVLSHPLCYSAATLEAVSGSGSFFSCDQHDCWCHLWLCYDADLKKITCKIVLNNKGLNQLFHIVICI